jgi:hypothetical protein
MASSIDCVTIHCADHRRLSDFWAAALGYEKEPVQGNWVALRDPKGVGPLVGFQAVPEPKTVKDRVHLDLKPAGSMESEVERLEGLGARRVRLVAESPDAVHTIMEDPEGNEFCVVQP